LSCSSPNELSSIQNPSSSKSYSSLCYQPTWRIEPSSGAVSASELATNPSTGRWCQHKRGKQHQSCQPDEQQSLKFPALHNGNHFSDHLKSKDDNTLHITCLNLDNLSVNGKGEK
jgi:hypothetical protein